MIIKRFLSVALIGIIISFSLLLYTVAKRETSLVEEADQTKSWTYAESVTTAFRHLMATGNPETAKRIVTELNSKGDLRISVFKDDGSLAFGEGRFSLPPGVLTGRQKVYVADRNAAFFLAPVLNEPVCYPCHAKQKKTLGVVAIRMPLSSTTISIADAGRDFIVFGILLVFSAAVAVFFVAKKMLLDPLAEIHRGVEIIKKGDLNYRISLQRSDELGTLAHTFDQMAERIERSHDRMEETIRMKTTELRVVAELSTEVFKWDLPLETIIGRFLDAIVGEMGFSYGALCLIDRETGTVSREFTKGLAEGFCTADISLAGDHPFAKTIREARPSVKNHSDIGAVDTCSHIAVIPILSHQRKRCREINLCSHENCPAFFSTDERCWLIPNTYCRSPRCIAGKEKIYGCLHCETFPVLGVLIAGRNGEVTKSSLHSLEILASEVTSAIENRRFIESKKEDINKLIKLHDISVRSLQSPGASLSRAIVSSVTAFSDVDAAVLWLRGKDGRLHLADTSNIDASLVPASLPVENTFIGKAIAEQRPVETVEMGNVACLDGLIAHYSFLYVASIPLKFKDTLFGCLTLFKKRDFRMSDSEKAVILLFASQSAAAMNTAELFASFRAEKEFSDAIFNRAASGIVVLDRSGSVLKINDAGAEILQTNEADITGRNLAALYPETEIMLSVEPSLGREVTVSLPDGTSVPVGFNNSLLSHATDEIDGIIVLFRNMTEIKRLQAELKKRAHFDTMSKVISGVAHEVRNPLFGISSIGQILDRELDSPQHKTLIQAMLKETDRMKRLIEELLLYTRPSRLNITEIDVETVLEELRHYVKAKREGVELSVSIAPSVIIKADRDKMMQVFLNLINNAVDAAKRKISVTAFDSGRRVEIRISDDGPGIGEEDMERIFDPFFTTKKGGTGLGLPICKKIIEDHGGEIEVKSSPATGTTAVLTFKV